MHFVYAAVFLAFAAADFLIAIAARRRPGEAARMLSNCMGSAGLVTVAYLISIVGIHPEIAETANLLSFCLIDVLLLYLLCFFLSFLYTEMRSNKAAIWIVRVFMVLSVVDIVSIMLNPVFGHIATYSFQGLQHIPHYQFEAHFAYLCHLTLCYSMLVFGYIIMLYRAFHVPRIYRGPIFRILACVLVVVGMNAVYLYVYSANVADISILFYSILGFAMYASTFIYGNRDAVERTSKSILDSSRQPTVIFDYKDELFMTNEAARTLFNDLNQGRLPRTREQFTHWLHIENVPDLADGKTRFYWTPEGEPSYSYICDYQELLDRHGQRVASYYVFTNNMLSVNSLTGFLTEQYFEMHEVELAAYDEPPVCVAVCDLNQLSLLNNVLGYDRGNDAIAFQANELRNQFPEKALFVRLQDAKLSVLTYGYDRDEVKRRLDMVNEQLATRTDFNIRLKMDFAVLEREPREVLSETARRAVSVLDTRKLLDKESRRSNTIDSLTAMLSECDGETEGHVRRTRTLGDGLAYELGLSDYERDQLSLLCLFHDIGKVGIPSHILNKPARLTDEERAIMQEHVHKGYRIARATAGLEIVAEPILHHHENWDGSGYPDGLQHEAIPILSRIISVVDSYDAMVSDRPYHKGISVEEACKELVRCSGKQFDPYIVDAFVRMVSQNKIDGGVDVERLEAMAGNEPSAQSGTGAAAASKSKDEIPAKVAMLAPVRYTRYLLSPDMHILEIDQEFEALTGYTAYDVESMDMTQGDLMFADDREPHLKLVQELLDENGVAYLEHRIRRKDGTGRYVYCVGAEMPGGEGNIQVVVTDITDSLSVQRQVGLARNRAMMSLRRLEESIQHDPLTNLLNQAAFRKSCERVLLDGRKRCVLVILDIDDFKNINDTYGHPKGDALLLNVAEALVGAAGEGNIAGRIGGDEFACMLTMEQGSSLEAMRQRLDAFWEQLSQQSCQFEIPVTYSAGAAWPEKGEQEYAVLYEKADAALYRAKRAGKHRLFTADEEA